MSSGRRLQDQLAPLPWRHIKGAASWSTQHTDGFLYHTEERELAHTRNAEKATMAQTPVFEVPKQLLNGSALFLTQLS